MESNKDIWKNDMNQQFVRVLSEIGNPVIMQAFLCDVLTKKEINEISARFEAAIMLSDKRTYSYISQKTKLSSRTVARISNWLSSGTGGYKQAIAIVKRHHSHILPDRD